MAIKYGFSFLIGLILSIQFAKAQQIMDSTEKRYLRSFLKLSISWDSGLEFEKKIGSHSALILFAGISVGLETDDFTDIHGHMGVVPSAFGEYRNYYNIRFRQKQSKVTRNNSANFLFGRVETFFPVRNQNYFNLLISQGWGAQRSIGKRIGIDFHIGFLEHFYFDAPPSGGFNYIKLEPLITSSLSYVF